MELKNLIHYFCLSLFLVTGSLFVTSCNIFDEDLPECRLYVKFKYDYNMLSRMHSIPRLIKWNFTFLTKRGNSCLCSRKKAMCWLRAVT